MGIAQARVKSVTILASIGTRAQKRACAMGRGVKSGANVIKHQIIDPYSTLKCALAMVGPVVLSFVLAFMIGYFVTLAVLIGTGSIILALATSFLVNYLAYMAITSKVVYGAALYLMNATSYHVMPKQKKAGIFEETLNKGPISKVRTQRVAVAAV